MGELAVLLGTAAVFGVVLVGLPLLAARVRRRGSSAGSSVMGPFEEIWYPAAARQRIEIEVQQEAPAPAPSPGDRLRRTWLLPLWWSRQRS